MKDVAEKGCKFMLADGGLSGRAVNEKYCGTLVRTGVPFLFRGVSFIIPLNFKHSAHLRSAALRLQRSSSTSSLDDYLDRRWKCDAVHSRTLTVKALHVFFIIVAVVCAILLVDVLIRKLCDTYRR